MNLWLGLLGLGWYVLLGFLGVSGCDCVWCCSGFVFVVGILVWSCFALVGCLGVVFIDLVLSGFQGFVLGLSLLDFVGWFDVLATFGLWLLLVVTWFV